MDFAFSEEQELLRSTVRTFIDRSYPEAKVRELMAGPTGNDPALWRQMADQLGLQGLAIAEQHGGSGFGFQEVGVVAEELGRALVPSPFLASVVLAGSYLGHCGDEAAQKDYLPKIAAGTSIASLAIVEESGRWDLGDVTLTPDHASAGARLSGSKLFVLDGALADLLLVAAREPEGELSVYAVESGAPGLRPEPLHTMDQTRKLAHLHLDSTPARLIGQRGGAGDALRMALQVTSVALAADAVGGAQRALEMAVEYAKVRHQFGRPIGSFQAIKHKCADMLVEVEAARSAAYYGVWCASQENDELPALASLAKSVCADAYFQVAGDNIQVHGGIGFTWEHPAHLYFKRAKSTQALLGDSPYHRERLASLAGIG
ncbi:MAG TPA: acyl-CoA dehydrogenase family protein [Streptosporangiaceae bacterium]|nr:acyl-CoA dehydrogenase family protein [Streptosporangiaceae bacterium]